MSSDPDSPHFGFLEPPRDDGKIYIRTIRRLEKQLKLFTSTPNKMDFCEQRIQGIDCDSGYVSSNLEPCSNVAETSSYSTDIYVSEDALMDKPDVKATEDVYEEFSHLYYLNNIVDASISTTKTDFSGFQDSDTSFGSQKSPILEIQPEISVCNNESRLVQNSELNLINQPNLYVIDSNQQLILINHNENVGFVCNNEIPVSCSSNELINQNNLGFNCNLNTQNSNDLFTQNCNSLINQSSNSNLISQNSNYPSNQSCSTQDFNNPSPSIQTIQNLINQSSNYDLSYHSSGDKFVIQEQSSNNQTSNESFITQDLFNQSCDLITQTSKKFIEDSNEESTNKSSMPNCTNRTSIAQSNESYVSQRISNQNSIAHVSLKPSLTFEQSSITQSKNNEDCGNSTKTKLNSLFKRSYTENNHKAAGKSYSTFNRSITESNLHSKINSFARANIENNLNAINCKASTPPARRKRKRSSSKTPCKRSASPDLFSDEESLPPPMKEEIKVAEERFVLESDSLLIKRVNETLSGVLPPPSLTNVELSVAEMLEKYTMNKGEFSWRNRGEDKKESLLVNTNLEGCLGKKWPDILDDRYHGLHYNRSKLAEEFESLCIKYLQRYVGSETQSSCTVFDSRMGSPSKRRANKLRWTAKSPGRRLSHLARRRITFSSANLQNASGSGSQSQSHARQIMVDARRFELLSRRGSPRKKSPRKTPRKSPRKLVRTPNSSAKKRLSFRVVPITGEDIAAGPSTSSAVKASQTKRALFRSPDDKILINKSSKLVPSTSNPSSSPWKKRSTPKRALFASPVKGSPSNKRKRTDSDESAPQKIARCLSMQEPSSIPGVSKLKSVKSDSLLNGASVQLSTHHKQKLFWAVNEAFRGANINPKDPQYTPMVSVLARVVRRVLPTMPVPKEGGTSTRMLRIAKQHIHSVLKGRTVEEIMQCYEVARLKLLKPTGYISKEEAQKMDVSVARSSVFQDKVNTIMNIGSQEVKAKSTVVLPENKADRVRKVINFDR